MAFAVLPRLLERTTAAGRGDLVSWLTERSRVVHKEPGTLVAIAELLEPDSPDWRDSEPSVARIWESGLEVVEHDA